MTEQIKVRVALVINEKGEWNAIGWSGASEQERLETALEGFDEAGNHERTYWLDAYVDVPEMVALPALARPTADVSQGDTDD